MSMQTTSDNSSGEPMMDINTTPLIDVMLVLLIMFIITIPIQTHAVKLDLPVNQPNPPPVVIEPQKNVVVVTAQGQAATDEDRPALDQRGSGGRPHRRVVGSQPLGPGTHRWGADGRIQTLGLTRLRRGRRTLGGYVCLQNAKHGED